MVCMNMRFQDTQYSVALCLDQGCQTIGGVCTDSLRGSIKVHDRIDDDSIQSFGIRNDVLPRARFGIMNAIDGDHRHHNFRVHADRDMRDKLGPVQEALIGTDLNVRKARRFTLIYPGLMLQGSWSKTTGETACADLAFACKWRLWTGK